MMVMKMKIADIISMIIAAIKMMTIVNISVS